MQIAKVLGTVVSTYKTRSLTGVKLLIVQFIDAQGQLLPNYEVAADIVGAGINEWVLVTKGSAARIDSGNEDRPLDAMVVGIIDTVTVDNRSLYNKKDEQVTHQLFYLARGPAREAICYKGYKANGFIFHTKDCENHRKTQSSEVLVKLNCGKEYYGVIEDRAGQKKI